MNVDFLDNTDFDAVLEETQRKADNQEVIEDDGEGCGDACKI